MKPFDNFICVALANPRRTIRLFDGDSKEPIMMENTVSRWGDPVDDVEFSNDLFEIVSNSLGRGHVVVEVFCDNKTLGQIEFFMDEDDFDKAVGKFEPTLLITGWIATYKDWLAEPKPTSIEV